MWLIPLFVLLGLAILALQGIGFRSSKGSGRWPLAAVPVLSEREQVMYQRLVTAFPDYVVLAQVALSQFIAVTGDLADRQSIQNRYFRLVADFVICRRDFGVVSVVELDDGSHGRVARQDADARKTKAINDAGLTLVRFPAGMLPSIEALRQRIPLASSGPDVAVANSAITDRNPETALGAALWPLARVVLIVAVLGGGWMAYSKLITSTAPKILRAAILSPTPPSPSAMPTVGTPVTNLAVAQAEARRVAAKQALEAQTVADAATKRKALAWAAYYQAPASCDDPPTWADQVECGNRYMRTKMAFEKEWAERNVVR